MTTFNRAALAKVLEILDSPNANEALAAAKLASTMVREAGLAWDDVLAPAAPAHASEPPAPAIAAAADKPASASSTDSSAASSAGSKTSPATTSTTSTSTATAT